MNYQQHFLGKASESMAQPVKALVISAATGSTSLWTLLDHGTTIFGFVGAVASATVSILVLINYIRKNK